MLLSLCNEVLREMPFAEQCQLAVGLGYGGLEVAPFTLADDPRDLGPDELKDIRRIAADHGLVVTGLHWLLVAPKGLSITTDDAAVRQTTIEVLQALVAVCAALGGSVMVHGSPLQRRLEDAASPQAARDNAAAVLTAVADRAGDAGITYCLEPLAPRETGFINTVEEAVAFVQAIDRPALKTMIDTSAAGSAEDQPVAEVIRRWWPSGQLAHIQVNDTNRRAPGQGTDRFRPVFQALKAVGYDGPVAVEPFVYEPDGPTTAALAAGYLKGVMEDL